MYKLRCYAKKEGALFVAVCIDLCLAAQGATIEEAKANLDSQIAFYLEDVCTTEREYLEQLLNRKAPLQQRFTYHFIKFINNTLRMKEEFQGYFRMSPPYGCNDHSHSH